MLSHTTRKRCELAPCCAPLHRFPPVPIVFWGQMSCCQLGRFCSESIGFHWSCDSLCRPKKSCDLAPCWARFRRIPSTPIDSTAKISISLISQFWVDRFNFAKLAYCHIGDSLSKTGFGVTDTSNPVARDFLNSKKVSKNNLSDKTWQLVWQCTERNTDGILWLELPGPSLRRHILRIRVILGIIGKRMNVCLFH